MVGGSSGGGALRKPSLCKQSLNAKIKVISDEILVHAFIPENCIDGKEFFDLSETDIKEMVPPIGLARKVMRLFPTPKVIMSTMVAVCHICCLYAPTVHL